MMDGNDNEERGYKVYPYRWVVLTVFLLISAMIQLLWATFFSITTAAWKYFGFASADSGERAISLLSVIFMIGMVALSVPAFAAFEKWGFKKAVSFGAAVMGVCGVIRGIGGNSYRVVLAMTIGFAVAQPFIMNAPGLVAGKWFPESERATANGAGLLANYVGMSVGLIVTPLLYEHGMGIRSILLLYGAASAVSAVLFIAFAREKPPTPPCSATDAERLDFREGLRGAFKKKNFRGCLLSFFLLFGIFNTVFTMIEPLMHTMSGGTVGSTQSGVIGVVILIVGIVGSLVISMMSDRDTLHRRLKYIVAVNIVGMIGFAMFLVLRGISGMIVAGCIYGFFTIGSAPVLLTLAAEEAYPTSEGTSEGMMMLTGNIGGVILIGIASLFGDRHMLIMLLMLCLTAVSILRLAFIRESKLNKEKVNDMADGQ
ncbi:MFS transporter [Mobilibacterium timonense]|uniref:MFS transporter n=1 Tax=Mobilibacterium timonense TaxID=1871012 RepID=UPI00098725CF|nr:MFS transporter [Mobilibacterium timonense]